MSRQPRNSHTTRPPCQRRGRRVVLWSIRVLFVLVVVALLFRGRGILASWARWRATHQLTVGALTQAQQWLTWSVWLDPHDGTAELMRARCFRHLKQEHLWWEAVQAAKQKGAPAGRIQQEIDLALIRAGRMQGETEDQLGAFIDTDASPGEVVAAFVYGYLRRDEPERAKAWLNAFAAESPDDAQVAYLRGIVGRWQGDRPAATAEFEQVLAKYPGHELARVALAEMAEEKDLLHQALEHYVEMATRSPACEAAQVGIARVMRKRGRVDEARVVMASLAAQPTPSSEVMVEMGHIELESGDYTSAKHWFAHADVEDAKEGEAISAALLPFAADSGAILADRLFAEIDAVTYHARRLKALDVRLAVDSDNTAAAEELRRLSSRRTMAAENTFQMKHVRQLQSENLATSGADLYAIYCSACHGENGDGNGRAARHLFPRPSSLRTGAFRLVSTRNGVATTEDLEAAIRQGMPGTAMRSFEKLTEQQISLLAQEVSRLNRDGIRQQIVDLLTDAGEEIDADELHEVVQQRVAPGEEVVAPRIGPADPQAIERGRKTYLELNCNQCHGNDGVGERDMDPFDTFGRPTRGRDLVREPFKGGQEPASVFLRIYLGMPGTVHPACLSLPETQVVDLVQYCRSLSREPKRLLTNHERSIYSTSRAYMSAFGATVSP